MIRCITFGLLSLVVFLAATKLGLFSGAQPYVASVGLIAVAMLAIFHLCEREEYVDRLTKVAEEASHIAWPNRIQMAHAAKVGVAFMVIMVLALTCLDTSISFCLEMLRR